MVQHRDSNFRENSAVNRLAGWFLAVWRSSWWELKLIKNIWEFAQQERFHRIQGFLSCKGGLQKKTKDQTGTKAVLQDKGVRPWNLKVCRSMKPTRTLTRAGQDTSPMESNCNSFCGFEQAARAACALLPQGVWSLHISYGP